MSVNRRGSAWLCGCRSVLMIPLASERQSQPSRKRSDEQQLCRCPSFCPCSSQRLSRLDTPVVVDRLAKCRQLHDQTPPARHPTQRFVYPRVRFLGTGAAMPGQFRNVSGILLEMSQAFGREGANTHNTHRGMGGGREAMCVFCSVLFWGQVCCSTLVRAACHSCG